MNDSVERGIQHASGTNQSQFWDIEVISLDTNKSLGYAERNNSVKCNNWRIFESN